jgi:catechol 2,3-dioxygenase
VTLPGTAHIGSVALVVSDLGRSLGFYEDTLGFRRLQEDTGLAGLSADGARLLIELHELQGVRRRRAAAARRGRARVVRG